jgi:DNA-directed RNA polymerase specialized sigma24 family protein
VYLLMAEVHRGKQLEGDCGAVEDALQEVFLAVWRTASAFRGEATVNTWIVRIAHYQVARRQRSRCPVTLQAHEG